MTISNRWLGTWMMGVGAGTLANVGIALGLAEPQALNYDYLQGVTVIGFLLIGGGAVVFRALHIFRD